jgi:hypothetical protein
MYPPCCETTPDRAVLPQREYRREWRRWEREAAFMAYNEYDAGIGLSHLEVQAHFAAHRWRWVYPHLLQAAIPLANLQGS